MAAEIEPANTTEKAVTNRAPRPRSRGSVVRPLRSIAIFASVGALVAAFAFPAYASLQSGGSAEASMTLQEVAEGDAQSLVVASEATSAPLDRSTYTATTQEEIDQKKAEEAAAARARAAAAAASSSSSSRGSSVNYSGIPLTAPGSGEVRYPLVPGSYYVSRTLGGAHQGADMVQPAGNPIYAATSGTVRISTEGYFGYGVAVVIDGVVGGQQVSTLYGHMTYGSRLVSAGQYVEAGQLIGQVGNTGNSYGAHLHFEVRINGGLVEPIGWLGANAG